MVGSANMDMFFKTPRLPAPGETMIASSLRRSYGGKGANQAVAIARLGGKAVMVCRLGDDEYGRDMLTHLQHEGVETGCIRFDPDTPSGMAFITVDEGGENTIIVFTGANGRLDEGDIERAHEVIKSSDACVAQMEIPFSTIKKLAATARTLGVPFILNPAPAPVRDVSHILKDVEILCPNWREAELLSGTEIRSTDDAARAGRMLRQKGAENVVLTLGAEGALAVTHESEHLIPSPKVPVCDTTGAGDAFVGGFAFARAAGNTIEESARFANVVAAISVTKEGTQTALPTLREVEEFDSHYRCFT